MKQITYLEMTPENLKVFISEAVSSALAEQKQEKRYLTRDQVTKMLSISLPTLHAWINEGKIIARKVGRRTLFLEEEINQSIERKEVFKFKHSKSA